jgi:hypothetical protein
MSVVDDDPTRVGALRKLGAFEIAPARVLDWVVRRRIGLILGLGVLFRVAQYLADRPYWLDEASLAGNIAQPDWRALFGPLRNTQLAPPGFLMVEWGLFRLLGAESWALRLFPLGCGIASLFLFRAVAARCLRPGAVWIALGCFAVSDDLIYFASELKQYTTDVAVGLACLLMGLVLLDRPLSPRRLGLAATAGALAVWFSHPAAFVLAGAGTVLIASALGRRQWRRALALAGASLAWAASFALLYAVAMRQLGPSRRGMWRFWDFAFPPMPPRSAWEAAWVVRRFLYLFVNPLDFSTPLGPRLSALPILVLFAIGCAALGRNDRTRAAMLAAPGVITMLATCLHLYPFHGRLVLFLVPTLLLFIAEGAAWLIAHVKSRTARALVLAVLFLCPTLSAFFHLVEPRGRIGFNSHGDRRPPSLEPERFPL